MFSRRTAHVLAGLLILVAVLIRLSLVLLGWPQLNSDEATMGLMARHIAFHADHPAFFYGQSYMGTIEAYLAAALFKVFSASTAALRIPSVLLYGIFLCLMYALARLLWSPVVALATLAVLAVGPEELLFRQIEVVGGYQETLVFASALVLISALLLCSNVLQPKSRVALLTAWGLCAGLGLWSDALILPFVLTTAVFLLRYRGTSGLQSLWPVAAAGFVVGLLPIVLHDISSPAHSAVGDMLRVFTTAGSGGGSHISFGQHILGFLAVSLPLVTGARPVCALPPSTAWPLTTHPGQHVALCTAVHVGWSGVVMCLAAAAMLGMVGWRKGGSIGDDKVWAARTALLDAAVLTSLIYILSNASAADPRLTARYLSLLLIAAPALLHPLLSKHRRRLGLARAALVGAYILILVYGTLNTFDGDGRVQAQTRNQEALVRTLRHRHLRYLYTDYRTCDRLAFQSSERIVCGVLTETLRPGQNRLPAYLRRVQVRNPGVFLFPEGAPQIALLEGRPESYRRVTLLGYVLFQR